MPIAGAFLDARPMFNGDCETGDGKAAAEGRGFPSSRAWSALCSALPYAGEDAYLLRTLAAAIVGRDAAAEFAAFVRPADLPDPKT